MFLFGYLLTVKLVFRGGRLWFVSTAAAGYSSSTLIYQLAAAAAAAAVVARQASGGRYRKAWRAAKFRRRPKL